MGRPSRNHPLTAAQKARIVSLWADGVPTREIAAEIGCSVSTINFWRDRLDLPCRNNRGRKRTEFDQEAFARMWVQGVSATEISAHFGMGRDWAAYIADRLGLERPEGWSWRHRIDRGRVLTLWQAGLRPDEIGRRLGCRRESIYRVARELGLTRPERRLPRLTVQRDPKPAEEVVVTPLPRIHIEAALSPALRTQYRALVDEMGLPPKEALARMVAARGVRVGA